jgi:hypothetical protein
MNVYEQYTLGHHGGIMMHTLQSKHTYKLYWIIWIRTTQLHQTKNRNNYMDL